MWGAGDAIALIVTVPRLFLSASSFFVRAAGCGRAIRGRSRRARRAGLAPVLKPGLQSVLFVPEWRGLGRESSQNGTRVMPRLSISIEQSYSHTEDAAKRRRGRDGTSHPMTGPSPRPNRVSGLLVDSVSILVIVACGFAIYALR
jgi:hypothetical protein